MPGGGGGRMPGTAGRTPTAGASTIGRQNEQNVSSPALPTPCQHNCHFSKYKNIQQTSCMYPLERQDPLLSEKKGACNNK